MKRNERSLVWSVLAAVVFALASGCATTEPYAGISHEELTANFGGGGSE